MINNMKHTIRTVPTLCAAALCAVVLAAPSAKANSINGSIAFSAQGVVVNNANLALATSFYVDGTVGGKLMDNIAYVSENPTGNYLSVPLFTQVTFNGFTFNPQGGSVNPLWTFAIGPVGDQTVYSFDATTITSSYNASKRAWDIEGNGMAMETGYSDTLGSYDIQLGQSGASFNFGAATSAPSSVPDGGSSMTLLGSAVLGLGVFGRKYRC
jgi:hypothetical protein